MFLCVCNWFQWRGKEAFFEHQGDHADEMETSLLLYLMPHLVRPLNESGDGSEKKIKIGAVRQGWCWAERRWSQVTDDTGIGNPKAATREKGEQYFKAVTEAVAEFFVEVAGCDAKQLYE